MKSILIAIASHPMCYVIQLLMNASSAFQTLPVLQLLLSAHPEPALHVLRTQIARNSPLIINVESEVLVSLVFQTVTVLPLQISAPIVNVFNVKQIVTALSSVTSAARAILVTSIALRTLIVQTALL